MCGIAGIVAAGEPGGVEAAARSMQRALLHRGPDSQGMVVRRSGKWTVALAHTRLAILDLSEGGHQPMGGENQDCWITYNGEIYSFRELRDELGNRDFRSDCDTEVLLRAYEKWGLEGLAKLRGMYAAGIWDEKRGYLTIARDPLGIKPLYYYRTPDLFVFASEVRALLASGLVPRRISQAGLESFLGSGSPQAPLTLLDGVFSVMPGSAMSVKPGAERLSASTSSFGADLFAERAVPVRSRAAAAGELRGVLEDSVRHHLISDVPLGVFLSGGIDSSALVALASGQMREPLRTFSIVFNEAEFSEVSQARLIASKYKTEHREILLSESGILSLLPEAMAGMDQPTADSINTFAISKAVKESGVTVALSGLGGDELFAGYQSFSRAARMGTLARIPRPVRRAASAAGRAILNGSSVRLAKFWDLLEGECTADSAYALSRQLFPPAEIRSLLPNSPAAAADVPGGSWRDPVNAVSVHELRGYMANTLLRDSDFMSMAHALEIRVPFVDKSLVRYVLDLPGEWKLDAGRPKPLLLDAVQLPEEIWRRPKMGFVLPFRQWMQSALRPDMDRVVGAGETLRAAGLDPAAAGRVWNAFLANPRGQRWARPWALYALSEWCERHQVRA